MRLIIKKILYRLAKKKPLTKKQIFDLQFKWDYPSEFRIDDNWWNNEFYWRDICVKQNLPEEFIREYQNRVEWKCISFYQNLSIDFIKEFQDRVDLTLMSFNKHGLSVDFLLAFSDKVNWGTKRYYDKVKKALSNKDI